MGKVDRYICIDRKVKGQRERKRREKNEKKKEKKEMRERALQSHFSNAIHTRHGLHTSHTHTYTHIHPAPKPHPLLLLLLLLVLLTGVARKHACLLVLSPPPHRQDEGRRTHVPVLGDGCMRRIHRRVHHNQWPTHAAGRDRGGRRPLPLTVWRERHRWR